MNLRQLDVMELSISEKENITGGIVFFLAGFAIGWAIATHLCDCPGHNN